MTHSEKQNYSNKQTNKQTHTRGGVDLGVLREVSRQHVGDHSIDRVIWIDGYSVDDDRTHIGFLLDRCGDDGRPIGLEDRAMLIDVCDGDGHSGWW